MKNGEIQDRRLNGFSIRAIGKISETLFIVYNLDLN
jgi:hypothetical protein